MKKNELEAVAREGAAFYQSVCMARRLMPENASAVLVNELDEASRCLETSVAEIELVLGATSPLRECGRQGGLFLGHVRKAVGGLDGLDSYEKGTLADALSYAEEALSHLGFVVSRWPKSGNNG